LILIDTIPWKPVPKVSSKVGRTFKAYIKLSSTSHIIDVGLKSYALQLYNHISLCSTTTASTASLW